MEIKIRKLDMPDNLKMRCLFMYGDNLNLVTDPNIFRIRIKRLFKKGFIHCNMSMAEKDDITNILDDLGIKITVKFGKYKYNHPCSIDIIINDFKDLEL